MDSLNVWKMAVFWAFAKSYTQYFKAILLAKIDYRNNRQNNQIWMIKIFVKYEYKTVYI